MFMALNYTCSTQIPTQKHGLLFQKIFESKGLKSKRINSMITLKKAPSVQRIIASINNNKNKVYEDESEGIVCYEDENGEIICEGYDEGPRFQRTSTPTHHPRDAEIMKLLLQQSWLQIVKGEEMNHAIQGVRLEEDLNCNGFNSFS